MGQDIYRNRTEDHNSFRDVPIVSISEDAFGVENYVKAMAGYISDSGSPLSVSIQGEWGSGKSSFMKLLEQELTIRYPERYRYIWLSTWEYFLEKDYDVAVGRMVQYVIRRIYKDINMGQGSSTCSRIMDKFAPYIRMAAKGFFSMMAQQDAAVTNELTEDVLGGAKYLQSLSELKKELAEDIAKEEKEYLIFLDDFDRLDPRIAVAMLEAMKNLLDVRGVSFVMAVDFDVVSIGIKEKYGMDYINNRDLSRVFFDKIFQIAFPVPVHNYRIGDWMKKSFSDMGLFTEDYESVRGFLEEIMILCTEKNPRSMKGIMSLMQLVVNIVTLQGQMSSLQRYDRNTIMNSQKLCFLLAAMLKKYPTMFQMVMYARDLNQWRDRFYLGDHFPKCTEEEIRSYRLDKPWKQTIFRIYKNNEHMDQEYYRITRLMNLYEEVYSELGDTIHSQEVFTLLDSVSFMGLPEDIDSIVLYDGEQYDLHSGTQRKQGQDLIGFLREQLVGRRFHDCLDVGCGSGRTTLQLAEAYPETEIDAIDISEEQIRKAVENGHHDDKVHWQISSPQKFEPRRSYDLIFSNSSMHWMVHGDKGTIEENAEAAYKKLYDMLEPGGILCVHQGGAGTYRWFHAEAREALIRCGYADRFRDWQFPAYYPAREEYEQMLRRCGFRVLRLVEQEKNSESETLVEDFAAASLIFYGGEKLNIEEYRKLEEKYLELCRRDPMDSYMHRYYLLAVKEEGVRYDGASYDRSSGTQMDQGLRFLNTIDLEGVDTVLDVGCGNGKLTRQLWERKPSMQITGVDLSESQILVAREQYASGSRIEFKAEDFNTYVDNRSYDMVFSNAAMHWMPDPERAYTALYQLLKPEGKLAVCQGGEGCYRGLHMAARQAAAELGLDELFPEDWRFPAVYPSAEAMQELLENIGYRDVEVQSMIRRSREPGSLPADFAEASLIYYRMPGMTEEQFARLKERFLQIVGERVQNGSFESYVHRLYIYGRR